MTTTIVVVSYQGRDDLPGCLASCREHAAGAPLVVVDNASTDGSADVAVAAAPDATVIRLTENIGFAAGNNTGIRAAMKAAAAFVLLINQDAELRPGAVEKLADFLETHPEAAAVQAGVLLPDGRVNTLGNAFNYLGFAYAGGNGLSVDEARQRLPWLSPADAWEEGAEVPCASGAALMLRLAALQEVGLFEEELFLYQEDFELSLRLRSQGWKVYVLPSAQVVHHYHFSSNQEKWYYLERNRHWVWMAHMKRRTLTLLLLPALAAEIAVWIQAIAEGWWRQKLRSYLYWRDPAKRSYLGRRRRELQRRRSLSDRALLAAAGGQLESRDVGGSVLRRVVNPLSEGTWRGLYKLLRW